MAGIRKNNRPAVLLTINHAPTTTTTHFCANNNQLTISIQSWLNLLTTISRKLMLELPTPQTLKLVKFV
jgi:hypothetical protein